MSVNGEKLARHQGAANSRKSTPTTFKQGAATNYKTIANLTIPQSFFLSQCDHWQKRCVYPKNTGTTWYDYSTRPHISYEQFKENQEEMEAKEDQKEEWEEQNGKKKN